MTKDLARRQRVAVQFTRELALGSRAAIDRSIGLVSASIILADPSVAAAGRPVAGGFGSISLGDGSISAVDRSMIVDPRGENDGSRAVSSRLGV
jgi:hypothetical protein